MVGAENLEKAEFLKHFPVPHETIHRLTHYQSMLIEWNAKFNLVAESTIPHIWTRHFLDSAQLLPHIPKGGVLADIGSGAGFPGLVLSIMGVPNIHLIESIGKKANFLRAVMEELKLDVTIHNERVENIRGLKADIVTARAVTALPKLLELSQCLMKKGSTGLYLKGSKVLEELTESEKYWTFNHTLHKSISDDAGAVLIVKNLMPRHKPRRP